MPAVSDFGPEPRLPFLASISKPRLVETRIIFGRTLMK
jgi:hypothetical protein